MDALLDLFTAKECEFLAAAFDAAPNKKDESPKTQFYKNSQGVYNLPESLYFVSEIDRRIKQKYPNAKFQNTYTRCYKKGSFLGLHVDRPKLDLTLSVCVEDKSKLGWPLNISRKMHSGDWEVTSANEHYKDDADAVVIPPGQAAICEGRTYPHWRDPLDCADDDRLIYVFYHWELENAQRSFEAQTANNCKDVSFSCKLPDVRVLDDFLSRDECGSLISMAVNRMSRSQVVDANSGASKTDVSRTSYGTFFKRGENELVAAIERRISERVGIPIEHGEGLQVLRYGVGEEYKPHQDYFSTNELVAAKHLQRGGQRVLTFLVYLNTPLLGGATCFPDAGIEVGARQGRALAFAYPKPDAALKTLHGGMPVLAGEKWVITKWFREGKFI